MQTRLDFHYCGEQHETAGVRMMHDAWPCQKEVVYQLQPSGYNLQQRYVHGREVNTHTKELAARARQKFMCMRLVRFGKIGGDHFG